ncbi:S1 family serine peptidase [Actinokineospora terrae]|uniref:Trypsin n=1 Tax=Actinokineospora terrae TaxID=155974 RepID=A0A1H9LEU3_9PSEU|nr:serine protease [Actinokineospora terrae]SER09473.1 Trypsin [Actinokineospora terrae]
MRERKLLLAAALALAVAAVPVVAYAAQPAAEQPATAATPTDQLVLGGGGAQVVNGQRTTVRENPFVIAGMRAGGGGPQGQSCTASVVGKRKIITAAHCMIDATGAKHYLYGDDDLNTTGDETFRTKVVSFKAHPSYSGTGGWQTGYDVAVVTTEDDLPVPESQWARVAGSGDSALTQPGKNGTAVGYGRTSANGGSGVLYKTTMPVNDASGCQVFNTRVNPDLMVCVGYDDGRTATCTGDSGGPFTVDGVIVGVVSWGSSGCDRYSIMARLTNAMGDWARSEIGGGTPPGDGKFTVAVSPSSGKADPGKYISATVATTAGDQPERVELSATGQPAGVSVRFQPAAVNSGESAKVTFDVAASAAKGSYPITVSARGSTGSKTATYTLTVGDGGSTDGPRPTASPSSATVARGGSVKAAVTVAGGTGASRLSATGLTFAPMFFPFSVSPGGTSQMSVFAPFQPGTYKIVITATDTAGRTGQTEFALTVT